MRDDSSPLSLSDLSNLRSALYELQRYAGGKMGKRKRASNDATGDLVPCAACIDRQRQKRERRKAEYHRARARLAVWHASQVQPRLPRWERRPAFVAMTDGECAAWHAFLLDVGCPWLDAGKDVEMRDHADPGADFEVAAEAVAGGA